MQTSVWARRQNLFLHHFFFFCEEKKKIYYNSQNAVEVGRRKKTRLIITASLSLSQ